ncbi:MAG TPA: DUF465 domain-containing protein [Rhizomicrobium sp.]|nr:DUF465 domain-containing protein [Rhizomicrobium sp.]
MHSHGRPAETGAAARTGPKSGDGAALRSDYVELLQQHHDLDYMISSLAAEAGCDELLVARLKKRKLRLKDEIVRVGEALGLTGDSAAHP